MKIFLMSLLSLVLGTTSEATSSIRHSVKTQWCINGSFHFIVQPSGPALPAPVENCFTLGSATVFSHTVVRLNEVSSRPVGNFFVRVLQSASRIISPDLSLYQQPEPVDYIVRQGRCDSAEFFVVERDLRFPTLPANNTNPARDRCTIYSDRRSLRSHFVFEGVYSKATGQSLDHFIAFLQR